MSLEIPPWMTPCVLTIGNFDGVHLGHRSLLERLLAMAKRQGLPSVVLTFDPPPLRLLRPEVAPKPLTWNRRREFLMRSLRIDHVYFLPTTHELLDHSPKEFFDNILLNQFQIKGMVEGPNFRFGKNRAGDIETLRALCEGADVELQTVEPKTFGQTLVSSTQIRQWIEQGNIQEANEFLVEPYRISGVVGHGAARGRTLGFPTANIENIEVLIPKHGVYAARVTEPSEISGVPVALHIGPNPTFGEDASKVEAHLLDYQGDLYGKQLELEILGSIRGVQKFQSKEELLEQLRQDVAMVRSLV